jgi:sugar (pentulose or hexulose) kinase
MKTIELTDEQAEELRSVIIYECDRLDEEIKSAERLGGDDDAGAIQYRHEKSVLSDILRLLEIA